MERLELVIDSGLIPVEIFNKDKTSRGVFYFNPNDTNLLKRLSDFKAKTEVYKSKSADISNMIGDQADTELNEELANKIYELDLEIKRDMDILFDSNVSDIVFGNVCCISTVNGTPLFETTFNALIPFVEKSMEAEAKSSQKRIEKYTKHYQR